ncbi:MAG: DNA repair protein RecO C-terminal domain-containing protein [Muribaculaceae bacterium]|nr:DNA repair protein RecO C-terminal domain-containing protein [Muribaculaceae bacterium]
MQIPLRGILLQTIRHNDRNDIITLFTEQRGRVTLLSPSGSTRNSRMRRARLAPLALIETQVNFRENRDLQFLGEVATPHPWRNIYFDPMKGAIAIFIGEFLNKLLRTSEPDVPMWRFLLHAIDALDTARRGVANYHLAFLIRTLPFVGILPDIDTYAPGSWFDLRAGAFTEEIPVHTDYLHPAEAGVIPLLLRMNFHNMHSYRFNVDQRRRLLNILLRYYSIHLPIGDQLRSLDVLRDLFT